MRSRLAMMVLAVALALSIGAASAYEQAVHQVRPSAPVCARVCASWEAKQ